MQVGYAEIAILTKRSFNIMPKTTEQHLIALGDKSVANNKRLCSTFCTRPIEANY